MFILVKLFETTHLMLRHHHFKIIQVSLEFEFQVALLETWIPLDVT